MTTKVGKDVEEDMEISLEGSQNLQTLHKTQVDHTIEYSQRYLLLAIENLLVSFPALCRVRRKWNQPRC